MIFVFLFVLGTIIGSFLNVVALRWNTGLSLGGRSSCAVCQKPLVWWELVPILGFFFVRGRCSGCRTKISWQYPLVEIFTGLVFASLYMALATSLSVPAYIFSAFIFCIYILILVYDLRHMIIPDSLVFISIGAAVLFRFLLLPSSAGDWLVGPALFAFFGLIWLVSKGRAMGFGDAKLALSIGLFLGLPQAVSAIVLSFWIGTIVSLVMLLVAKTSPLSSGKKRLTMKSEVPFAPFMILGAWIALVLHLDLFHVLTFF